MHERIKQLKKISQQGFTLIELMAVLAILAILLAIAIPAIGKLIDKSDASSDKSSIELMERAGELAHTNKLEFDEPNAGIPEESYMIPTLIEEGYLDLDEDSKFNLPENYVVKESDNLSGTFVYKGVGATTGADDGTGNPGDPNGTGGTSGTGTDGVPETAVGPSIGYTPLTEAPDGCTPITSAEGMDAMRNDVTGCYTLMNPIDLAGYTNWSPIQGALGEDFTGSFDGQRYPITGLTINRPTEDYVGLFGPTTGATFTNIALENVSVIGEFSAAGLTGVMEISGSISDSYVTGSISSLNSVAGSFVGETVDLTSGSIENSYSSATVTAKNQVGGLVGYAVDMTVDSSYFDGVVNGGTTGDNVGGIAGYFEGGSIDNAYSSGAVSGNNGGMGGLVGNAYATTISKSFATGNVDGYFVAGGLVGSAEGTTIIDSYATGEVSGADNIGGLVGVTMWGGGSTVTVSNTHATGAVNATENRGGTGGLIGAAEDTALSDSYATGTVVATSLGSRTGAGGLIGALAYYSSVTDSYSTGSVTSVGSVGGLVGFTNYGANTIANSYALGSVTNLDDLNVDKYPQSIGGFVGRANTDLTITNSYARGDVNGVASGATDSAGGFLGEAVQNITLTNVYATGDVLNSPIKGGLVGQSLAIANVADSYYNSEVSGLSDTLLGTPKTTSQLQQKATFANWDFGTIWSIKASEYPTLQ